MFEYLYEWMRNISFYLVLVTAVTQVIPNQQYKKYVRFFTGLVLVLMMMTPIFRLFGMEGELSELYESTAYENQIEELKKAEGLLYETEDSALKDIEKIEVEEIQID